MNALKFILKQLNIEYKDFADTLEIDKSNITLWTSGKRPIPNKWINRLSIHFQLPEYLFKKDLTIDEAMIIKNELKIRQLKILRNEVLEENDSTEINVNFNIKKIKKVVGHISNVLDKESVRSNFSSDKYYRLFDNITILFGRHSDKPIDEVKIDKLIETVNLLLNYDESAE